jgi:hypothetical protein
LAPLRFAAPIAKSPFGTKDIGAEAGNPVASDLRHVEIANFGLDVGRHGVPLEMRIAIDDVGGRVMAKLAVDADFFEFTIERVGLPDVVGIAEWSDESRSAKDRHLHVVLLALQRREPGRATRCWSSGGMYS